MVGVRDTKITLPGKAVVQAGGFLSYTHPNGTTVHFRLEEVKHIKAPTTKEEFNKMHSQAGRDPEAIMKAGGPPNVVTAMAEPTIESAQELMKHRGVRLLVVTGGPGVVKAAMVSASLVAACIRSRDNLDTPAGKSDSAHCRRRQNRPQTGPTAHDHDHVCRYK